MTVSSTTNRWEYTGDGTTVDMAFNNKVFSDADILVYVAAVLQTLNTHYTVALNPNQDGAPGGTVTFLTAPALAAAIVIVRDVPNTQETDFPLAGPFLSQAVEDGFDRRTIVSQQNIGLFERVLRFPVSDPVALISEFPAAAARAGKLAGFDASGNTIATAASLGPALVSPFMETLLDDTTAAAARATLGVIPGAAATRAEALAGTSVAAFLTPDSATAVQFPSPGGRLTLTSGTPVTVGDVAGTTIFYTPDIHNRIRLYDGTQFVGTAFAELTLALDSDAGHAGYHQSGVNFDLFVYSDAGTLRLGTRAWTNDTTRAVALARIAGVLTNGASITLRFGTASGNTSTVDTGLALYVGTFRASADGQATDSHAKRFVWNMYNRRPRPMRVLEATDSWTYSTTAFHQANASAANQLAMVRGLDEDAVEATVQATVTNSGATPRTVYVAIGLGSSTAFVAGCLTGLAVITTILSQLSAFWRGLPGIGYRDLRWLEYGAGADTQTWYGDAGGVLLTNGITGMVWA